MTSTPLALSFGKDSEIDADADDDYDEELTALEPQFRNVFIHDASNAVVAGTTQRGSITISTFYRWLDMILFADEPWFLLSENGNVHALSRSDNNVLPLGTYIMVNDDRVSIYSKPTSIPRIKRIYSRGEREPPTSMDADFTDRVTSRDGLCCMTQVPYVRRENGEYNEYLPATHIYPLAYVHEWISSSISSSIIDDGTEEAKIKALLSPQNGITLGLSAQTLFDSYGIAVDVDDDYRLVELSQTTYFNLEKNPKLARNGGAPLELQPSSTLLKEHFTQALIQNVLGDGLKDKDHRNWLRERSSIFFGERVDLSHKKWTHGIGKDILERILLTELYGCLPEVEGGNDMGRWSAKRLVSRTQLTETSGQDWPDKYDLPPEVELYKTKSNPIGYSYNPTWYNFLYGEEPTRYIATPPFFDPDWKYDDPEYQEALKEYEERSMVKFGQYVADMHEMYPPGTLIPSAAR